MSNQYRQLIHQLPVSRLSVDVLFALAFILDECETEETLKAEMDELTQEYLQEQLIPKWHQCVKKGLADYVWEHQDQSAEPLIDEILDKLKTLRDKNHPYHDFLAQIKRLQHADSLSEPQQHQADTLLTSDWRKQVMGLLLPAFTVFKPGNPS